MKLRNYFVKRAPFLSALIKNEKGSATVEAIALMPIIIIFYAFVFWFIDIYRIHSQIGAVISEVGEKMIDSLYPYDAAKESISLDRNELLELFEAVGFSELYVKRMINSINASKQIKDLFCTVDNSSEENALSIVVTYRVDPPIVIYGYNGLILSNSFYSKTYTGYVNDRENDEYVYITKGTEVYHTQKDCSALKSNVSMVFSQDIKNKRNDSGGKYYPCNHCKKEDSSFFYITKYGNKYHWDSDCKDLRIHIYQIPIKEARDRRKCYFCE